eukprot:SM000047S16811  [mRNA]  locus=s47:20782:24924:+ [translate_table: standard]
MAPGGREDDRRQYWHAENLHSQSRHYHHHHGPRPSFSYQVLRSISPNPHLPISPDARKPVTHPLAVRRGGRVLLQEMRTVRPTTLVPIRHNGRLVLKEVKHPDNRRDYSDSPPLQQRTSELVRETSIPEGLTSVSEPAAAIAVTILSDCVPKAADLYKMIPLSPSLGTYPPALSPRGYRYVHRLQPLLPAGNVEGSESGRCTTILRYPDTPPPVPVTASASRAEGVSECLRDLQMADAASCRSEESEHVESLDSDQQEPVQGGLGSPLSSPRLRRVSKSARSPRWSVGLDKGPSLVKDTAAFKRAPYVKNGQSKALLFRSQSVPLRRPSVQPPFPAVSSIMQSVGNEAELLQELLVAAALSMKQLSLQTNEQLEMSIQDSGTKNGATSRTSASWDRRCMPLSQKAASIAEQDRSLFWALVPAHSCGFAWERAMSRASRAGPAVKAQTQTARACGQ